MQLINSDCLSPSGLPSLPDQSVDMVLTDLPYGTTACKWDVVIPFEEMWEQLGRVCKPNAAIVLFGSEPFASALRASNFKMYKYDWVWEKNKGSGHLNAKKMPMKYHETISVFYKKPCTYNPQFTTGHAPMNYAKNKQSNIHGKYGEVENAHGSTIRGPRSILKFPVVNNDGTMDGGKFHPTQKPLALLEYLINTYTKEGETVLDFTMGSGSTGVACASKGREFIGMEMDIEYFKIAKKRVEEVV